MGEVWGVRRGERMEEKGEMVELVKWVKKGMG